MEANKATTMKWFQNGPTTHLTDDGKESVCGQATVPSHVTTHEVTGDEYVCGSCERVVE